MKKAMRRRQIFWLAGGFLTVPVALAGQHETCISVHLDGLCERLNQEFAEPPIRRAVLTK